MKVVVYDVCCRVSDVKNGDIEIERRDVVAPDMSLEDAKKYMFLWALHNWPNSYIHVDIIHIDKKYEIGWV